MASPARLLTLWVNRTWSIFYPPSLVAHYRYLDLPSITIHVFNQVKPYFQLIWGRIKPMHPFAIIRSSDTSAHETHFTNGLISIIRIVGTTEDHHSLDQVLDIPSSCTTSYPNLDLRQHPRVAPPTFPL
jgi:hypothetical protein